MAFYGDDFTGSTDVMESLALSGVKTILFVTPPDETSLAKYADVHAVGVAGNSRTISPGEMEVELAPAFGSLRKLQPAIVHYKTCSTFDSSPMVGSIGRAIEIGQRVFNRTCTPLVVGAPVLKRYCVFGNLFASSGLDSAPYRLDRHPTMSRHPATPMNEADLRVHLSEQTRIPVQLVDVLTLDRDQETRDELVAGADGSRILLFDTLTNDHQQKIGRIIWKMAKEDNGPLFVAGSSGVEYALTSHWIADNVVSGQPDCLRPTSGVDRILVVSGSCSPVTQRQIQWAVENGFVEIGLRTEAFGDDHRLEAELAGIVEKSAALLGDGRSVIVHTSRGPDDPRIAATKPLLGNARASAGKLGNALGRILESAIERHPLNRVAVTGGDTSGHVARSLGIDALEMLAPLAPGSPLCEARSSKERIDGLEITFKGGQVGHDDFFATVLAGKR